MTGTLIALLFASVTAQSQSQSTRDLFVGTWERVPEGSTCEPGPCPVAERVTAIPQGAEGLVILLEQRLANGDRARRQIAMVVDGKEYPVLDDAGKPTGTTWAIRPTGPRSFERVTRTGGRVTSRQTDEINADGVNRFTVLVGQTPDGRPRRNVTHWVKR